VTKSGFPLAAFLHYYTVALQNICLNFTIRIITRFKTAENHETRYPFLLEIRMHGEHPSNHRWLVLKVGIRTLLYLLCFCPHTIVLWTKAFCADCSPFILRNLNCAHVPVHLRALQFCRVCIRKCMPMCTCVRACMHACMRATTCLHGLRCAMCCTSVCASTPIVPSFIPNYGVLLGLSLR